MSGDGKAPPITWANVSALLSQIIAAERRESAKQIDELTAEVKLLRAQVDMVNRMIQLSTEMDAKLLAFEQRIAALGPEPDEEGIAAARAKALDRFRQ